MTERVEVLKELILNPNCNVRRLAVNELVTGNFHYVVALLRDRGDTVVRRTAVWALGERLGKEISIDGSISQSGEIAIGGLIELLVVDPEVVIRKEVAETLGKVGHHLSIPALLYSINNKKEEFQVTSAAKDALQQLNLFTEKAKDFLTFSEKPSNIIIVKKHIVPTLKDTIPTLVELLLDNRLEEKNIPTPLMQVVLRELPDALLDENKKSKALKLLGHTSYMLPKQSEDVLVLLLVSILKGPIPKETLGLTKNIIGCFDDPRAILPLLGAMLNEKGSNTENENPLDMRRSSRIRQLKTYIESNTKSRYES